jgi:hypothetical protein
MPCEGSTSSFGGSTSLFGVWHRRLTCSSEGFRFLGHVATADEAKAIAQTDTVQLARMDARKGYGMSPRQHVANRRASTTFDFRCGNLRYTCSYSRFASGGIAELFLSNHKSNSHADTAARDSAITFSIAVQHGADSEIIRRALCRDSNGKANGPLGTALDLIFGQER